MRMHPGSFHGTLARITCILAALAGCGGSALAGDQPTAAQALEKLDRAFADLEAADAKLPRDGFDPAAIVQEVGKDPAKLFEWVRDRTTWVPYRGTLRGPAGVLSDRLGDSLDRSLLLAELLHLAGHEVALAHADLSDAEAAALLPKIRPQEARAAPTATVKPDAENPIAAASRDVEKQIAAIVAALGQAPDTGGVTDADARAALRDHWWVQRREGAAWVDLDPLLPDAAPGQAAAKAQKTVARAGDGFKLDAALYHEVRLRVVVEVVHGAAAREQTLLEHKLRASEIGGARVVLRHMPVDWTPPPRKEGDDEKARVRSLSGARRWQPILCVGADHFERGAFDDGGEVREGGLGLGGLGGAAPQAGTVSAEWLDIEAVAPGRPPRTARREIFDALGPARRAAKGALLALDDAGRVDRALALLAERDIVVICARPTESVLIHREVESLSGVRAHLTAALRETNEEARRKSALASLSAIESGTPAILAWSALRDALRPAGGDTFIDVPQVVTLAQGWRTAPAGPVEWRSMDLALAGGGASSFAARVAQGVADAAAEALVMESQAATGTATVSAFRLLAGAPLSAIRAASDPALAALPLSDDARARVRADLAAGAVVLIPSSPVSIGGAARTAWWRFDPASGATIDVMESGFHQTMEEDQARYARMDVDMLIMRTFGIMRQMAMRGTHARMASFVGSRVMLFRSVVLARAAVGLAESGKLAEAYRALDLLERSVGDIQEYILER